VCEPLSYGSRSVNRRTHRCERGRPLSQPSPQPILMDQLLIERSTAGQIPVVVLAGFLGSGKTTLLNHLLHRSGGSRIGAIVNDFGAIEIDAMAVAGVLGDSTVSLGNGCLCCAVDASELDEYLGRLAQPSTRIDVIVIEGSGLPSPRNAPSGAVNVAPGAQLSGPQPFGDLFVGVLRGELGRVDAAEVVPGPCRSG